MMCNMDGEELTAKEFEIEVIPGGLEVYYDQDLINDPQKDKCYITDLLAHNVPKNNIYVYGFAFQGKKVLISGGAEEVDWMSILDNN